MLRGLSQCRVQCFQDTRCAWLARPSVFSRSLLKQQHLLDGLSQSLQVPRLLQPCTALLQQAAGSSTAASAPPSARPKLFLVDGNNMAMRAYFGIFKSPIAGGMQTTDGIPTPVTYGFMRSLVSLLDQERPDAVIVVFDAPGGNTFRRELLPAYKANRTKPASNFSVDMVNLKLLLKFTRIPTLAVPGYEADDVMAGLAAQAKQSGYQTLLISTDKDLWQVVDDAGGVAVLKPSGGSNSANSGAVQLINEAAVQAELGVGPQQVPELKALMGDSSDNIPGIPGIGPKTAAQLMQRHGSLTAVFQNALGEKKGVAAKLSGREQEAELYKSLATVRPEAAPVFDFVAAKLQGFAADEVEPLLARLQMTSLVKDLPRIQRLMGGAAAPDPERLAALPGALQQVDACAAALLRQQEGDMQLQELASDAASTQPTEAEADKAVAASSTVPATAAANGPVSGAGASRAADVLAAVPAVRLISTLQGLHALVAELQQQPQVCVTWSWPQHTPYQPGTTQQQPPQVLCCAWQHHESSGTPVVATDLSANSTSRSASASSNNTPPPLPRRRRRTRTATSLVQQQQQQQPVVEPVHAPSPAPQPVASQPGLQLAVVLPCSQLPAADVLVTLRPLLESQAHPKCLFESKRAYTELYHRGIQLAGVQYDVLVAGCLPDPVRWADVLKPEMQQAAVLPVMLQQELNTRLQDMAAALQAAADTAAAAGPVEAAVWQSAAEAWATLLLHDRFSSSIQQLRDGGQLQQLLDSIELPLQRVLSSMEVTGVHCDKQILLEQRQQLQAEVTSLEKQLYSIAGRRFNLNSPKECSAVMYDELGLKGKGVKKTKSGYYSTSMSEIDKLEPSPFKDAFVEWSRLDSLLSKYYGQTYMGAINEHSGRIHTTFHQVGIATGRLASSNPNMQAVPAHDERGRMFRAAFTADDGHLLVAADYSQVELRVMAALSGDEALLAAFANGQDVHAATARDVLGKGPQDPLTAEERQLGKKVNFSIVYGAGARQLAAELGMSQKQAQQFMDSFKEAHPKLYEYKTYCMRSAVAWGYTLSATGRRRLYTFSSPGLVELRGMRDLQQLPDMKELQKMAGRHDVHVLLQASNAPIQGTSADVLKAALIQLHNKLVGPPHNCRLMLTAHDDVLLEVPSKEWPAIRSVVELIMEQALPQHGLMLKAEVAAGSNWLECKP